MSFNKIKKGPIIAQHNLNVAGTGTFNNMITALSSLNISGNSTLMGTSTFGSTLNVSGASILGSSLSVSGATTLIGASTIGSTLTVNGNVGIGTASTSNALEVSQSGTVKLGNALYTQLRNVAGTNYLSLSSYVANLSVNNLTQTGPTNGIYTYTANSTNYAWVVCNNNPVPANTTLYYIITISSNSNSFVEIKGSNNGVARIYYSQVSSNINSPSVLTLGPYTTAGYVGNLTIGIFSNSGFGMPSSGSSFNLHSIVISETIPSSFTDTIMNGNVGVGISNPSTLLHVSGSSILSGATTTGSTLNIVGALTASSTSILSGATTAGSTLNVTGALTAASTSVLSGASTAGSTLNIVGALTASSTSILSGASTAGSTLNVVGALTASSTSVLSGASTAGSTLNVVGALTASSTSVLLGANTMGSTLNVVGAAILSGATTIGSTLNVSSSTYLNGNVGIGNTAPAYKLDVIGDINYTGNFYKNGTLVSLGSKQSGSWLPGKSDMSSASKTVVSSTGQYQIIMGNNTSGLFLSADSGNTWSALTGGLPTLTGSAYWSDAAISSTGQYITLSVYGGSLWMSSDYGKTFALTNQPTPNIWLPLNGNTTDTMGLSTVTPTGAPGYVTINYPGYTAQAVNLANTAGGTATRYVRGTWTGASNFTVSLWFNAQALGAQQQALFVAYGGNYVIALNASNQITWYIPSGGSGLIAVTGPVVSINTWYYVSATFQTNGTCSLYVNNTLAGTYTNVGGVGSYTTAAFAIGTYDTNTVSAFNGYVDDVKITNTVSTYVPIPLLQPNIWLPFENSTADLGSNAITSTVTGSISYVPGIIGLNAVNLVNTLGPTISAPATQYIRGAWNGSSKWTVSFWFNMQSYSTSQTQSTLFSSYEDTLLIMIYNNSLGLYTNAGIQIATSNQPAMNTWHYVTYIHQNNGLCSFYLNNSLVGTYNNPSALGTATRFSLGTYNAVALYPFNGYIDDFRIYSTDIPYHTLVPQNYRSLALSGTGQYALASTAAGWVVGSSDLLKTWSKQAVNVGTQGAIVQPNKTGLTMVQWEQNGINWVVSASSILNSSYSPHTVFSNNIGSGWANSVSTDYTSTTYSGSYSTIVLGSVGATITGEWIQIQTSVPLALSSYSYASSVTLIQLPRTYYIVGSTDGINWYPIHHCSAMSTNPFTASVAPQTYLSVTSSGSVSFTGNVTATGTFTTYPTSTNTYTYFRFITRTIYSSSALHVQISQLYFNFARASTQSLSINHTGQYQMIATGPVSGTVMPNQSGLTTSTWSQGGVNWGASASTILDSNHPVSNAFNNNISGSAVNRWASPVIYSGTGAYTGSVSTTIQGIGAVLGEWIQLTSSVPLVFSSYTVSCGGTITTFPKIYYIAGSNDGSTWSPLQLANITTTPFTSTFTVCSNYIQVNVTGTQTLTAGQAGSVTTTSYATSTQAYTYFRIIVNTTAGSTLAEINEFYPVFQNSVSYSTNYGSTWLNTSPTVSNESVALAPAGQYALSTNMVQPFARLTLDNTNVDMQGVLAAPTVVGTSFSYSDTTKVVGTHSINFANTAGATSSLSYLNYTVPASLYLQNALTMACWIYPTANPASGNPCPMGFNNGSTSPGTLFQIVSGTNYINFSAWTTTSASASIPTTTAVTLNTWTHLVGTFSNGVLSFYVNGILQGTATVTGSLSVVGGANITNLFIGAAYTTWGGFRGNVDDVRIYTSALNADEINSLYNNPALTQTIAVSSSYLPITSYTEPILTGITANIVDSAVSETGQYMIVVTSGTTNNMYYSTDFGATFTALTLGTTGLTSCAISYDGSYMTAQNATTVYSLNKTVVSSQWTTSGANIYYNIGNAGIGTTAPAAVFHVSGTSLITGPVTSGSTLNVVGSLTASSTSILTGATTTGSTLNVTGALTAASTSVLTGATTTGSTLNVTGALTAASTSILSGASTVGSSLNVSGTAILSNNVAVGRSSARYTADIVGTALYPLTGAASQMIVSDSVGSGMMNLALGTNGTNNYAAIQSSLSGTGPMGLSLNPSGGNVVIGMTSGSALLHVNGTSILGSGATCGSTLNVAGSLTAASTSILTGASTFGSTLNVIGALTASSTSILSGASTIGSTLNIAGALTASGTSILSGASTHGSTLNIVGALSASSTSILLGAVTTGSTLNVMGALTASSTSILSGATTLGSTLYVSSSTYLNGNVGVGTIVPAYKLDVSGDINYTGNFYKNGTLVSLGSKQSGSWLPGKSDMSTASKTVVSSNGQYQMIIGNTTSNLFLSADSGNTWSALSGGLPTLTGSAYWSDGVISSTGQYITLSVYGGSLWMSSDYGLTFALSNQPTPNIWLPLNGNTTDTMGLSTVTTPGTVPGYVTINYPGYTAQAINLANTAGGTATRYVRGTWTGAANFTVSLWVNPQTLSGVQQQVFAAYAGGMVIFINSSNQLSWYIPSGGAGTGVIMGATSFALSINTWYYVTVMFQTNGLCSLYVNNNLIATYTNVSGVGTTTTTQFSLGCNDNSTVLAFNGYIDDVKITNSVSTYVPIPLLQPNIWMPFENSTSDLGSNAITPTVTGSVSYVPGVVGLNAVNLVNTAGGTATNYIRGVWAGANNFTISFWFNPQSIPTGSPAVIWCAYGAYVNVQMSTSNQLNFCVPNGASANNVIGPSAVLSLNTWYHVYGIFQSNGTCSLYLNGALVGTYTNSGGVGTLTTTQIGIGVGDNSTGYAFNGYIDDFRLYNSAIPINTIIPQNYKSLALSGTGQYALASAASGWVVGSSDLLKTWTKQAVNVGTQSNIIQPNRTGLTTSQWEQNGVNWVASASTILNASFDAYRAFDTVYSNRWVATSITYSTAGNTSGITTTIQGGIGTVTGDWLQLQSSVPVIMASYQFGNGFVPTTISRLPRTFHIVGSNDGTTWYPIQSGTGASSPTTSSYTLINSIILVNNASVQTFGSSTLTTTTYSTTNSAYLYFRLVCLSNYTSGADALDIGEWVVNFARPSTQSLAINHTGQYQMVTTGPVSGSIMPNSTIVTGNTWTHNGVTWTSSGSSSYVSIPNIYYVLFNTLTTAEWVSSAAVYNTSGNTSGFNTTFYTNGSSTSTIQGDWLQLQSSTPLVMSSYQLANGSEVINFIKSFYIVGSNDGSTWYAIQYAIVAAQPTASAGTLLPNVILVNNASAQTFGTSTMTTTTYSGTTNSYTYFRMIVVSTYNSSAYHARFTEWLINFQNSVSYSTNYGSTWLNTVSTVSNESVALAPAGQYALSTNTVSPFARLTLDNTNLDMQGGLTPTTGAGTVTYSTAIMKVGTHSAFFNNTAAGTPANYLNYTVPTVLNTPSSLTMACWIYPTAAATNTTPMALCSATSWGNHFYINASSTVNIYWATNNTNAGTSLTSTTTAPLNTWTHLTMTYTGSLLSLYVNGIVVASTAATGSLCLAGGGNLTNVLLGCGVTNGNSFAGYVDDARIYTSALNADEVNGLFKNPTLTQTIAVSSSYLPITSYSEPTFPSITSNIVDSAVSETGQYMIAVTSGTTNNLYISTDFGATFTAQTLGTSGLTSCAISYDGSYMTAQNATTVYSLSKNIVSSQWTTSNANIYYNIGNVGIGTTAPSALFHISGTSLITGAVTTGSTLNVMGALTASSTSILTGPTTTGSTLNVVGALSASSTSILSGATTIGSTLNVIGAMTASSTSILSGASTMGSSLFVSGTSILQGAATTSSTLNVTGALTAAGTSVLTGASTHNSSLFVSGTTTIMGNVGIGITAPTHLLHIGRGNDSLRIGAIGYIGTAPSNTFGLERSRNEILFSTYRDAIPNKIGAKIIGINKQTYTWSSASEAPLVQSTDLVFYTVPQDAPYNYDDTVERMRITDNGNMGIGTSGPTALLHISGTSILNGASTHGSTLNVAGALTAASTSILSGASTHGSSLFVSGAATASSTLNVAGALTAASTSILSGASTMGSSLFISGTSILQGAATTSSTLNVTGAMTAAGTSVLTGASTHNSSLFVSGTTTIIGNVGIGTVSQVTALTIQTTAKSTFTGGNAYAGIHIQPTTNIGETDKATGITWSGTDSGTYNTHAGIMVQGGSSYGSKMYFQTTNSWGTGSQNRMIIDHNGNMGIGTIIPAAILHVSGTSILSGATTTGSTLNVTGALTAASTSIMSGAATASSTLNVVGTSQLAATNISGSVNVTGSTIFNNPSGDTWQTNVGINNNSSVASYSLLVGGSGNGSGTAGVGGFAIHGGLSGSTNFRLNINSNGNVGINNTSPATTLDVNGTIQAQTAFQSSANASNAGLNSMQYVYLGQSGAAAARGTVVRIGDINGAAYYMSTGSYNLSFYKDVSGVSAVSALQIIGTNAANTTPNVYVNNSLGVGTNTPATQLALSNDFHMAANSSNWNSTATKGLFMRYSTNAAQDSAYIQSVDRTTSTAYPLEFYGSKFNFANGNLGVGNTTPAYKLDVTGNINFTGSLYQNGVLFTSGGSTTTTSSLTIGTAVLPSANSAGTTTLVNYGNACLYRNRLIFSSSTTDWNHCIYNNGQNNDNEGAWDGMKMNVYNGLNVRVGTAAGAVPTSALYINSSAQVSIGTTSPPAWGQTTICGAGTNTNSSNQLVLMNSSNNNMVLMCAMGTSASFIQSFQQSVGAAPLCLNQLGGNVGIGTNAPAHKLHISGAVDGGVEQYNVNTSAGTSAYSLIGCRNNTPSQIVMFLNSSTRTGDGGASTGTVRNDAGDLRLQGTSATNGIHIKGATGNVGIGTTSPSTLLDVRGTIFGNSIQAVSGGAYANSGYVTLQVAGNTTNTGYIEFRNSDATRMCYIGYGDVNHFYFSVEQSRNLIFNTNNTERMRIANTGDVTCTGDITAFASTSDIRLKENIIVLPSALNIIKMLNPVTFTWKHDIYNEMYRGKDDVGFIAQEVEQVIPKAVGDFTVENNTFKKIRHERILPYVVKSVQELETENASMKQTITELQNENASIKEQLARLMTWAQTMGMN